MFEFSKTFKIQIPKTFEFRKRFYLGKCLKTLKVQSASVKFQKRSKTFENAKKNLIATAATVATAAATAVDTTNKSRKFFHPEPRNLSRDAISFCGQEVKTWVASSTPEECWINRVSK